jgi:hypothetical protein
MLIGARFENPPCRSRRQKQETDKTEPMKITRNLSVSGLRLSVTEEEEEHLAGSYPPPENRKSPGLSSRQECKQPKRRNQ